MKEGDILCDLNYFKVVKKTDDYTIFTDLLHGRDWALPTSQVPEALGSAWSADTVNKTETVSQTEIVEKMVSAGLRPFTVTFIKQNNEERTLRGKFVSVETAFGRSLVCDLDKIQEHGESGSLRLIDHRTIKSLILDGVQYNV